MERQTTTVTQPARYNPARGGHAPGLLRDAFAHLVETGTVSDDLRAHGMTSGRVVGQLWNCTDIMPSWICDELNVPLGSTYARGARALKEIFYRVVVKLARERGEDLN
jgi:hypothetical protein